MSEQINTNWDRDPFDDENILGRATAVDVRITQDLTHNWRTNSEAMSVVPDDVYGPAYSGSGNLVVPGPPIGWYWFVYMIVCTGFSAGTVSLWKNDATQINPAAERFSFSSGAGTITLGKNQFTLSPNDVLYFVPSGVTGTISVCLGVLKVKRAIFQDFAS